MLPVLKPVTKLTKGGGQTASMKARHTSISCLGSMTMSHFCAHMKCHSW